ncbi:hypothetical protein NDU88_003677 [Pleurodeles waltl]|uniref:Uncharacterized protein n=1 Tax=Pleurodeles waltl TaxID=8319 RepID=A0AAV7UDB7_PLEWA|nr:hypothetical protein NDU88_003677 [Pleurodeles waltl]
MPSASPSSSVLRAAPGLVRKADHKGLRIRAPTASHIPAAVNKAVQDCGGGAPTSARSPPAPSGHMRERRALKNTGGRGSGLRPRPPPRSTSPAGVASLRCPREALSPRQHPPATSTTPRRSSVPPQRPRPWPEFRRLTEHTLQAAIMSCVQTTPPVLLLIG